jgi:hypothetical protein
MWDLWWAYQSLFLTSLFSVKPYALLSITASISIAVKVLKDKIMSLLETL